MPVEWSSPGLDFHLDLDPAAGRRHGLAEAIRHAIRDGRLAAGTRLPSTRALAADLGLARGTVTQAFDELAIEGYLRIQQGAGAVVVGMPGQAHPPHAMPPPTPRPTPRWNLLPGRPDVTLFPRTTWLAASRRALTEAAATDFGYGAPEGHPKLRKALADYLGRSRGVVADPDAILISAGYSQSLSLLAAVLRDRGEHTVGFENPSFDEFRRVMAWAGGLKAVGIPVDGKGIIVDQLAGRRDLGAVVVTPAHQYPLGSTLDPARRAELVEFAHDTDTLIIEDDYDGEFRFDRQPIGALQALAPERVVYTGTASKTLAPGLRISWLVLPSWLVEPMRVAKRLADRHTGAVESLTLAEFLTAGQYDQQVRRSRTRYRARRERLLGALGQDGITVWPASAAAGLHLVLPLPDNSPPEEKVLAHLARHAVAVEGLSTTWLGEGPKVGGLIVGYAAPPEHAFGPAINALITALRLAWR
ncbi:MAG TPA: PLP-dependent aminotransferase family protein [Pseudonocardiaceae bacterium]|jgi:GntR family transcriptional regulator/MocR family aminotransferase|nr:PLP-dependent aminotransferase family protein [Pseudonocardiaceae bacterium]